MSAVAEKTTAWTPEEDALALSCYNKGLSHRQIMRRLAEELGANRSRCAVIARLYRLGRTSGSNRSSSVAVPAKVLTLRRREAAERKAERGQDIDCPPYAVTFEELASKGCKFPYGASAPFKFCGRQATHGSYCADCSAKVLQSREENS